MRRAPPESTRDQDGLSLIPTELSLHRADVNELGLHFDHESSSTKRVPREQVNPAWVLSRSNRYFAMNLPAQISQSPLDMTDAPGVCGVPCPALVEQPWSLDPQDKRRAKRPAEAVRVVNVQRRRHTALDLGHEALRPADCSSNVGLGATERTADVSHRRAEEMQSVGSRHHICVPNKASLALNSDMSATSSTTRSGLATREHDPMSFRAIPATGSRSDRSR